MSDEQIFRVRHRIRRDPFRLTPQVEPLDLEQMRNTIIQDRIAALRKQLLLMEDLTGVPAPRRFTEC